MEPQHDTPGFWRTSLALLIVLLLALVGLLDYVTGPWMSFALLYVLPVLGAAWWLGRGPALLAAVVSGLAWFEAEAWGHRGESGKTLLWNSVSRLIMLVAMAAMVVRIREDRQRLKQMNAQLAGLLSGAEKLARTDSLTGLANRRAFLERLGDELARVRRSGGPVCIAYLDVDNFKTLNDKKGHLEGDEFLRRIAHAIKDTVRASDVAARLGGDEFAVLFADAKRIALEALAQRLLARVRALGERYPGLDLGASVGMAWFAEPPESAELLLQRADAAMYSAKKEGKHRFALWEGDAEGPVVQS
ncbi:MAG: diguanylate cyclase [Deltaproteobacteria bacterium]|nr:MAG: diguanylate cyclase [Deltaproteobacteria bacterium]